jgi:hypothetical protein
MQRKQRLVDGHFVDRWQGQRRLEDDESTRAVTKHEVRTRFGKQRIDILAFFLQPNQREFCRTWPEQSEVIVQGLHNLQEDSPDEIGQAIASWLQNLK